MTGRWRRGPPSRPGYRCGPGALGFTSWQVRGTLYWQALTLAGMALVIGVPAGIACGRLCWQIFAHQLGITPVVAVPLAVLAVMAAGWLAAAAVIAMLPAEAATRNPSRPGAAQRIARPAAMIKRAMIALSDHRWATALDLLSPTSCGQ
jgi:hypothetical protein